VSVEHALHVAFVIEHAYVDALACFREPIKAFAARGAHVDVYTRLTTSHPVPTFSNPRIRVIPLDVSYGGAIRLVARLAAHRPRYAVVLAAPQWGLYWAVAASTMSRAPIAYISDELIIDSELTTAGQRRWKARERRAHQRCAFTIALSQDRADFLRGLNRLAGDHPMYVVPNSAPGPAVRQPSHFYQELLGLPPDRCVILHAGGMGWQPAEALAAAAATWGDAAPAIVFQGRLPTQMRARESRGAVWYSPTTLPADLLDHAVSSAHIGLALYDAHKTNDRLMGTASGKLCLYMKNALPVITTRLACFDWVEREGCGVRVQTIDEIPAAARAICADYDRYADAVRRYYAAHLDFAQTFEPVIHAVEVLAGRVVAAA
jgi:hypothetical protein